MPRIPSITWDSLPPDKHNRRLDVVDEVGFFPLDRFDAVCIDPRGEYLNCQ
jgi:hypothetical protein